MRGRLGEKGNQSCYKSHLRELQLGMGVRPRQCFLSHLGALGVLKAALRGGGGREAWLGPGMSGRGCFSQGVRVEQESVRRRDGEEGAWRTEPAEGAMCAGVRPAGGGQPLGLLGEPGSCSLSPADGLSPSPGLLGQP